MRTPSLSSMVKASKYIHLRTSLDVLTPFTGSYLVTTFTKTGVNTWDVSFKEELGEKYPEYLRKESFCTQCGFTRCNGKCKPIRVSTDVVKKKIEKTVQFPTDRKFVLFE